MILHHTHKETKNDDLVWNPEHLKELEKYRAETIEEDFKEGLYLAIKDKVNLKSETVEGVTTTTRSICVFSIEEIEGFLQSLAYLNNESVNLVVADFLSKFKKQ